MILYKSDAFNCKDFYIFYQPIIMIFRQFVIYVLIYDYLKFRNDPSITSQEIANYISVALAVALSVYNTGLYKYSTRCTGNTQEYVAPPQHDWKIVYREVKPQSKQNKTR